MILIKKKKEINRRPPPPYCIDSLSFCQANKISIVNMEDIVPRLVQMKRDRQTVINYHHYRVEIFGEVYPKNYDFIYFFLNKVVSIFNLITINILLGY